MSVRHEYIAITSNNDWVRFLVDNDGSHVSIYTDEYSAYPDSCVSIEDFLLIAKKILQLQMVMRTSQ